MSGLLIKDFLVFKKRFRMPFRVASVLLLLGTILLLPSTGAEYVYLLLPPMSLAFLTELVTIDEKSEWKKQLPVLPLTYKEIVLSRYAFCAIFVVSTIIIALALGGLSVIIFGQVTMLFVWGKIRIGFIFAMLMMVIGIPCGYFFKGEVCTGSMMIAALLMGIIHNTQAEQLLINTTSPPVLAALLLLMAILLYGSFRFSLLIYTQKIRFKDRNVT